MARLPIDLMTVGNRDTLPSARMVVERATPEDFGGQVGRSLQNLGEAGLNLAMRLKANDEKIKGFDYERQFLQLQEQDNLDYETRRRELQGPGEGHWTTSRDVTNKRFSDWLQTLPEKDRAEYAAKAQAFQTRRTAQAFKDQYTQQDNNTRLVLTEEERKAGVAVAQQPTSYEQFIKDQESLIDKSTLTPLEKDARKQQLRNSLAYTAAQAEAQQNPAGVVAANVGGGFRETLRRRESGNDDNAAASSSSALGRYQFLSRTWNQFASAAGVPAINPAEAGGKNDPRRNPEWQEKVLDQYIASSTAALKAQNLPVTDANLYVLHFMGQGGGTQFLQAMSKDGGASAAAMFPEAAAANRSIFFAKNEPRTMSEVYATLTRNFNGAGVTAGARTAAQRNLTAEQQATVSETAINTLLGQQRAAALTEKARQADYMNDLLMRIKEGPSPETALEDAKRSGALNDFDARQRAEKVLRERQSANDDLNAGLALVDRGKAAANQFNPDHRKQISTVYDSMVKQGVGSDEAAMTLFNKTGIVPKEYVTGLRGALASENPNRMISAFSRIREMLLENPAALNGVDGGEDLKKNFHRFSFLSTDMGKGAEGAAAIMMREARDPSRLDPVKQETLARFSKDYLTQEKIASRMTAYMFGFGGVIGGEMPRGEAADVIGRIYGEFAREGFEIHRDSNGALKFADDKMKEQFGVQNGVITRYAPEKAGLPSLPGIGHKWVTEQALQHVRDTLDINAEAGQVVLLPIERRNVSTSMAFNSKGMPVMRDGTPDQRTQYMSIPYQIVVLPKGAEGVPQYVPQVYFPDVDAYVEAKNKQNADLIAKGATTYTDAFGSQIVLPSYMADEFVTPAQQAANEAVAGKRAANEAVAAVKRAEDVQREQQAAAKQTNADRVAAIQARLDATPDTPMTANARRMMQEEIDRNRKR